MAAAPPRTLILLYVAVALSYPGETSWRLWVRMRRELQMRDLGRHFRVAERKSQSLYLHSPRSSANSLSAKWRHGAGCGAPAAQARRHLSQPAQWPIPNLACDKPLVWRRPQPRVVGLNTPLNQGRVCSKAWGPASDRKDFSRAAVARRRRHCDPEGATVASNQASMVARRR